MNEFSFNKGTRLCKVVDSKVKGENGTEIFVYDPSFRCCIHCSPKCKPSNLCCDQCSKFVYHKEKPHSKYGLDEVYEELYEGDENSIDKDFVSLKSGSFQVIPTNNTNDPDTIYLAGSAGVGKSFWVAKYLVEFKRYYPKYKIYLFSQKLQDKHLDELIHKRIPLAQIEDAQFEISDFKNCLLIFDDIDSIDDKKINKATYNLVQLILEVGRSSGIFTILTSHLASDREKTKRILNRCTAFVFFKKSSGKNICYALENYMNFKAKEIKELMRFQTRTYVIFRQCPQIIMTDQSLFFQNLLDKD
jgi:DNA replication protein DnaC